MNGTVPKLVKMDYGNVTPNRLFAAWQIRDNDRLHKRLPRLSAFSKNVYKQGVTTFWYK